MPANLPPQYFEAEKRFRAAREPDEKIAALEAMLATMPHQKKSTPQPGEQAFISAGRAPDR
jgi:hypothetical protein